VSVNYIDSGMFKKMFISGAYNLEAKKEWINELNVFPVPDGDTGTNMTLTILSAVKEVEALKSDEMADIAKAISHGSLRGARGNSGVILSQLLRGLTREIQSHEFIDTRLIASAFERAVETAYKAVMKPKEGTILTVAKGMAKKAATLAKHANEEADIEEFLIRVIEEGNRVLDLTPELLPVLKEAGVVDSGGQGLMVALEGALMALQGKPVARTNVSEETSANSAAPKVDVNRPTEEIKFGYCTEFIINIDKPLPDSEIADLQKFLDSMGDSIVLVPDDDLIKIHVHTNDPGTVLHRAVGYGELSRIKIDNMREEHREMLHLQETQNSSKTETKEPQERKKYGFITVAAGDGFNNLFKDMEVDVVISGGQTMNPSTDDFIKAIEEINADYIFVYPNNKNIIMAANQARDLTEDKTIIVIPTKTVTQGITAMINFAPEYSAEENAEIMNDCISAVSTSQVTYAIRDTKIDDFEISNGDIMAVGDNGLLAVGKDITTVAFDSVKAMMHDSAELISIYYGEGYTEEQASELANKIESEYPNCSVDVQYGGQPVYYCVISVE
jgi:DAK2 domain fusion protein YloV